MWRSYDHPVRCAVSSASGDRTPWTDDLEPRACRAGQSGSSASCPPDVSALTFGGGAPARRVSPALTPEKKFQKVGRDLPSWRHSFYAWTAISRKKSTGISRSASGGELRPASPSSPASRRSLVLPPAGRRGECSDARFASCFTVGRSWRRSARSETARPPKPRRGVRASRAYRPSFVPFENTRAQRPLRSRTKWE